jgi:hypothetical protein
MATARITETFRVEEVPGQSRGGRQLVRLLETLEYRVGSKDSPVAVCVPVGFATDFASIPFGLRNLFPPLGCWGRPAIIHDYLYATRGEQGRFDRLQSDRIFLEAMEVVGVPAWRRTVMFRAVRLGGGGGWGS